MLDTLKLTRISLHNVLWFFISLIYLLFSGTANADVAVIVHPDNQVNVSNADISNIFLGKINSFPDGEKATPIVLKQGDPARTEFISKVLSQSETQYKAYWSRLIFTGQATPPAELKSSSDILERVSKNKDAIAFINVKDVTKKVRILQVF